GKLLGQTVSGLRQRTLPTMATPAALAITFEAADPKIDRYPLFSPTPPAIVFENGAGLPPVAAFSVNAKGNAARLETERIENVVFSPEIFESSGFGSIAISNPDGDVEIPAGAKVRPPVGGSLTLRAANLDLEGSVVA